MILKKAQLIIASNTAADAFTNQMPVAMALGMVAAKFELNPISSFKGQTLVGKLAAVGRETFEEAGQGGTGQLYQNYALQQNVNPSQSLAEGVGENIAASAIGGAGMSGALSLPSLAGSSATGAADVLRYAANEGIPLATAGFNAAREAAAPITDPIGQKIEDIANRPSKETQNKSIDAASAINQSISEVVSSIRENTVDGEISDQDLTTLSTLRGLVEPTDNGTLISKVSTILNDFKKTPPTRMGNSAALSANESFETLKKIAALPDLPESVRAQLDAVLVSPYVSELQQHVATIDLNQTQVSDTEINSTTIQDSLAVAKVNPANVNPKTVGRILRHSGSQDLTPEQIRLLESAAKIASAVNIHKNLEVKIKNKEIVSFTRTQDSTPVELDSNGKTVSRSILVNGFEDAAGNKLRSISQFAADIFKGAQNPNGTNKY